MFEAADDWHGFGESLLHADPEYNLTGRMDQEIEFYGKLQSHWADALLSNPDYGRIMALGAQLIAEARKRKYHPDGYKGSLRILREAFAFLTTDYGFQPGEGHQGLFNYWSPHLHIELGFPRNDPSIPSKDVGCWLNYLGNPKDRFWPEEILWMAGQPESVLEPPLEPLNTEAAIQAWFTKLADVLRNYAADQLGNKPGAFLRLAAAQAERESHLIAETERLWILEHPDEVVPKWTSEHGWLPPQDIEQPSSR